MSRIRQRLGGAGGSSVQNFGGASARGGSTKTGTGTDRRVRKDNSTGAGVRRARRDANPGKSSKKRPLEAGSTVKTREGTFKVRDKAKEKKQEAGEE